LTTRPRKSFEGLLDAAVAGLLANPRPQGQFQEEQGRTGSVYIVKPKMHGPRRGSR